jgi:hypothetical protein
MNGFAAIGWLARMGFLVKGVLYMVVDALAMPRQTGHTEPRPTSPLDRGSTKDLRGKSRWARRISRLVNRRLSGGMDEPVAEIVPNTQPILA